MIKKIIKIISISTLVFIALIYFISTYLDDAEFIIHNATNEKIKVTAFWRDKNKILGEIEPNEAIKFTIKSEASMTFSAKLQDGSVIKSEEIYFTSDVEIFAQIKEKEIQLTHIKHLTNKSTRTENTSAQN